VRSSELTGGSGFYYEGNVAAYYLAALLSGDFQAPVNMPIKAVKLQQSAYDAPLDDIIVEFEGLLSPQLHLQVKRSLIISSAKTNIAYPEIITNSWDTYKNARNSSGQDYYGGATDDISGSALRKFRLVCEAARNSHTPESFFEKTTGNNTSTAGSRRIIKDIKIILSNAGKSFDDTELHNFFKHLVILNFDVIAPESLTPDIAINSLRHILSAPARAPDLWERLKNLTRAGSAVSGTYNRESLISQLHLLFTFKDLPHTAKDNTSINTTSARPLPHIVPTIKCHIALSRLEKETAPAILTAIVLTDNFEGVASEIKEWRDTLQRSPMLSSDDKELAKNLALKDLFKLTQFSNILSSKLATLDFLAYVYYARGESIGAWSPQEKESLTLKVPLFHRLSKKDEEIVSVCSETENIKTVVEAAIADVHNRYHREVGPTLAPQHVRGRKALIELADLVADISIDYIGGTSVYPANLIAFIKTRFKYGENIVTGEKHTRDKNPLA
jgi:hypothetical protein